MQHRMTLTRSHLGNKTLDSKASTLAPALRDGNSLLELPSYNEFRAQGKDVKSDSQELDEERLARKERRSYWRTGFAPSIVAFASSISYLALAFRQLYEEHKVAHGASVKHIEQIYSLISTEPSYHLALNTVLSWSPGFDLVGVVYYLDRTGKLKEKTDEAKGSLGWIADRAANRSQDRNSRILLRSLVHAQRRDSSQTAPATDPVTRSIEERQAGMKRHRPKEIARQLGTFAGLTGAMVALPYIGVHGIEEVYGYIALATGAAYNALLGSTRLDETMLYRRLSKVNELLRAQRPAAQQS